MTIFDTLYISIPTFYPPFFTMKSQLFGSLITWSVIFLLDVFKIFTLISFNILFLWYISIWISLPFLRIIDLGVNILHHIYKVFNHYIFEIFKFLLLSSSPWNFDYTYVTVLNEVSHFLRLCSFYFFFLFVLRFIISTDLFSTLLILLLAQFYCLESLIYIFLFFFHSFWYFTFQRFSIICFCSVYGIINMVYYLITYHLIFFTF